MDTSADFGTAGPAVGAVTVTGLAGITLLLSESVALGITATGAEIGGAATMLGGVVTVWACLMIDSAAFAGSAAGAETVITVALFMSGCSVFTTGETVGAGLTVGGAD